MSVKVVHKKWEIVKICLSIIEENNEIVRRLSPKERRKENLVWNDKCGAGQTSTSGPRDTTLYPNQKQSQAQNRMTTQRKHK